MYVVANSDLQIRGGRGGGHPDPDIRGGGGLATKNFFSALRASFWSENKGRPGPPEPLPWIRLSTYFFPNKASCAMTYTHATPLRVLGPFNQ